MIRTGNMDLKHQVLKILEENRGCYINGARLADELYVTRSAVWKAIKALQKDNYRIEAIPNRGYRLLPDNDIVSAESISPYLKPSATHYQLEVRHSVGSTNTIAKEMAAKGAKEGTVIIALEQTHGRGRMGRSFYSPKGSGIYLSVILRPKLSIEDSLLITTCAAVAVARAIETVAAVEAQIKWVNDIYLAGKKVCGILTEASLDFESGGLEYAVVGIGINIAAAGFPDEIKDIAGSIFSEKPKDKPVSSMLVAEILNNISEMASAITDKKYLDEYRKRSFLIGKDIYIIRGSQIIKARAVDIDDQARLVVEYEDHTKEALNSGEVSVRPQANV